jgi:hypothetical protein
MGDYLIFVTNGVSYLLCQQRMRDAAVNLKLQVGCHVYICGFLRFVNQGFFTKLKDLLNRVKGDFIVPNEWLALYEILGYD